MGRIPGFTTTIFPTTSMPAFTLAANLGLVLFLFLVGLEVDLRFLVSNWRIALSVGAAGMALPFGLGAGIAYGLYHQFRDDPGTEQISFGIYLLFIGVAMAITAFPVLCRILTSLKLLGTPVGVIVLSAGVGNDVVGWILLALCVALVNSGAGLTALWILMTAVGYALFLCYVIRPAFVWVLRRTGSLSNGPTQSVVALTILLMLASAFFTSVIGIHPIFGAFMVGLICPHDGGFAIKLTEKIEDLVSVLFLPLYFALSGLSTNLGLLDNGITWAYVIGVCSIAFFGKIAGGTMASRLNGLVWRESLTIGCLMSCKGLVELIVLNIGLQANILSTRTFTIFVVMALITTFATTPLVVWLYPPWYQRKLELWKAGKIDWDGNPLQPESGIEEDDTDSDRKYEVTRKLLVYLRVDGLPSLFTLVSLLARRTPDKEASNAAKPHSGDLSTLKNGHAMTSVGTLNRPIQVHGLRLMELTERESSIMKVAELEEYGARDPIIKAFGTFGQSQDISISGQIAVVPEGSFSSTLMGRARDLRSDLILIPWSETGSMSEYPSLFEKKTGDPMSNRDFAKVVIETFANAREFCHVGVFIDKAVFGDLFQLESPTSGLVRTNTGISVIDRAQSVVNFKSPSSGRQRFVVAFGGSEDDIFAVKLALQFAKHPSVDVVVVDFQDNQYERTENANYLEYDLLQASMPEHMQYRVNFSSAAASGGLDFLFATLGEPTSAETILVVGRSGTHRDATSPSTTDQAVLGQLAAASLQLIREKALQVSLMIVQGRKESPDEELRRHKSMIADE